MSNYKRMSSIEPRSGSIHLWTSFSICAFTPLLRIASICRAKCDWTNYNRSSMQLRVLRTLMKDARGGLIR